MSTTTTSCPTQGCAHLVIMDDLVRERYRENHSTFYCPAGHSIHYPDKTEAEKKEAFLERQVRDLNAEIDDLWHKTVLHDCPWPLCETQAWSVTGLKRHMQSAHGMPTVAQQTELLDEIEVLESS